MVFALTTLCEWRCRGIFMESGAEGKCIEKWLLHGLPHSLPVLTIHNVESSANKRRYRMEQQIIVDRLLTNGRECSKDNVKEFVAVSQHLTSKDKRLESRNRRMKEEKTGIGREVTVESVSNLKETDPDQFYTPKSVRRQPITLSQDQDDSFSNSSKIINGKRVTFHPRHVKDGLTSESDNDSDSVASLKTVETDEYSRADSDATLTDGSSSQDLRSQMKRASSESKLPNNIAFHQKSSSRDALNNHDSSKTKALFRSASDRTLTSVGPSTLASLQVPRKDKKRRSIIKRKILKIHKAFRKKHVPLLEESEEAIDYPPGSDDSENISTGSECREGNGLLNSQDELDGKHSLSARSHSLPRSRRKSGYSSGKADSKSSSLHQSSKSSFELETALHGDQTAFPGLKPNSTSPAALNTLGDRSRKRSEDSSPRLTPTYSNFDESQLISPSMGIAYHPHSRTLRIQNDTMGKTSNSSISKHGSIRKKKRSGSWYNVLSPSYKQKNEDFHKFFKDLPVTERLLVTVNLVDIDQMTKEKTVKVIPNAIQVLLKDKTKITFTSFTARDRAYLTVFRLWQNALLDKPMSGTELWSQIHRNYGEELGGCSSDDDYVRPKLMPRKHQVLGERDGDLKYEFGTTNKVKKNSNATQTSLNDDKSDSRSIKSQNSSQDSPTREQRGTDSHGDDKSSRSSRATPDDVSIADDALDIIEEDGSSQDSQGRSTRNSEGENEPKCEESDDETAQFLMQDLPKLAFSRTYDTSIRDLYRIIFSDDCPFWKQTLVNKGTTGITFGTWKKDETTPGQQIRELSYTLRLDNSIGPKTSFVKETQIYYPCSVEGKSYVVDCIAQNFGIPYADYFYTVMRYCLRKVTKTSCELRITWELRYKKSPWALVKNFIEKNVASGMGENFKKLQLQLQERIDYEKSEPQTMSSKSSDKSSALRRRKRKSISPSTNAEEAKTKTSKESAGGTIDEPRSDMNNNKDRNSPSNVSAGVPPIYPPNGFIPNQINTYQSDSPKLHYFGQGGKFIFGAMLFLNYTMYQRLTTLEQVAAAAATAEGVDPSVTAAFLDRPGVQITSNPEILSTYLQAIDKRLRRLEDTVLKFTQETNSKWEKMEKSWTVLESLIEKMVRDDVQKGR